MKDYERRKHNREKVTLPLTINKLKGTTVSFVGSSRSRDLSEGGIAFKCPEFMPMAKRMLLEIEIPIDESSVKAIAKVAWISKGSPDEGFSIGTQFLEVKKEDAKKIHSFMQTLYSSVRNCYTLTKTCGA